MTTQTSSARQALETQLLNYPDQLSRQLTVVSKEEAEHPNLYHISIDGGIHQFVPRISHYQLDGEDRTVPRVVAATTLLGCILGYTHVEKDYLQTPLKDAKAVGKSFEWNNGYYIYELDYELSVKPTDELVPVASATDETWLLNYSPETSEYKPKRIGKFFVTQFKYGVKANKDEPLETDTILFIEVSTDKGIFFSKDVQLTKGYWQVETNDIGELSWKKRNWLDKVNPATVKAIDRETYMAGKSAAADMLSDDRDRRQASNIHTPAFAKW